MSNDEKRTEPVYFGAHLISNTTAGDLVYLGLLHSVTEYAWDHIGMNDCEIAAALEYFINKGKNQKPTIDR